MRRKSDPSPIVAAVAPPAAITYTFLGWQWSSSRLVWNEIGWDDSVLSGGNPNGPGRCLKGESASIEIQLGAVEDNIGFQFSIGAVMRITGYDLIAHNSDSQWVYIGYDYDAHGLQISGTGPSYAMAPDIYLVTDDVYIYGQTRLGHSLGLIEGDSVSAYPPSPPDMPTTTVVDLGWPLEFRFVRTL